MYEGRISFHTSSYILSCVQVDFKPQGLVEQEKRCICVSYNTGKGALRDIYARRLRACSAQGRVHIYQAKHECLCYN